MTGLKLGVENGLLVRLTDDAPKVLVWLVPEAKTQSKIRPKTIIDHSNAGPNKTPWTSLWAYINRTDVVLEAHCLVDMEGQIVQVMPFDVRADCNYQANTFAVSFETQDNGYPTLPSTEWTPVQFEALAQAHAAIVNAYPDVQVVEPATWTSPGIGHHSLFPQWSSYVGKTCPGAARIKQMPALRARVSVLLAANPSVPQSPTPTPPAVEEDEDMPVKYIRHGKYGAVYGCFGNSKTWIDRGDASGAALARAGATVPEDVDEVTCVSYGPILGPIPAGHDAYGRVTA